MDTKPLREQIIGLITEQCTELPLTDYATPPNNTHLATPITNSTTDPKITTLQY